MKYKEQQELVADLRALADFIARKESIVLPKLHISSVYANATVGEWGRNPVTDEYGFQLDEFTTRKNMHKYAKVLKPCKKNYYGESFSLTKEFGQIKLSVSTKREAVCKQVKTGEKVHHVAVTLPARTEEVVEWVCTDPILAG